LREAHVLEMRMRQELPAFLPLLPRQGQQEPHTRVSCRGCRQPIHERARLCMKHQTRCRQASYFLTKCGNEWLSRRHLFRSRRKCVCRGGRARTRENHPRYKSECRCPEAREPELILP